jgi:hypothetical protein
MMMENLKKKRILRSFVLFFEELKSRNEKINGIAVLSVLFSFKPNLSKANLMEVENVNKSH